MSDSAGTLVCIRNAISYWLRRVAGARDHLGILGPLGLRQAHGARGVDHLALLLLRDPFIHVGSMPAAGDC